MFDWIKRRGWIANLPRVEPERAKPQQRLMSGKYLLLNRYLADRYAETVVLTFAEIEDLLGFALPDNARHQREWWTNPETNTAEANYADSWTLASRTAKPNLPAQTVVFDHVC
jgi:hypothetical protein